MRLRRGDIFENEYEVLFSVKRSSAAETYCVQKKDGTTPYFLKLYFPCAPGGGRDRCRNETTLCTPLTNRHFCRVVSSGTSFIDGQPRGYLLSKYVSSETVEQRLARIGRFDAYDAERVTYGVLEALSCLHHLPEPVFHNNVSPDTVLINLQSGDVEDAVLAGFEEAGPAGAPTFPLPLDGESPFFLAPERFSGTANEQTDVFAAGALLYAMVYGTPPWFTELTGLSDKEKITRVAEAREGPLHIPEEFRFDIDENLTAVIRRALSLFPEDRYPSAEAFLKALKNRPYELSLPKGMLGGSTVGLFPSKKENAQPPLPPAKPGNGFADVAGMDELKAHLRLTVIDLLKNPERVERYRLSMPNGMLLYGPPGCGKTFFAEKFAEETGFSFACVKSSDLASIYIHGSQQMIADLFDRARKSAPSVLCFDEFDAMVPNRGNIHAQGQSGEVNEFLSQLNNCGQSRVFVIATSNKPELIDPAVLRKGRIDCMVYIPAPDKKARMGLFGIHLKGRPLEEKISLEALADKTKGYVASDIAYIVNHAALLAAASDSAISQGIIEMVIKATPPSVSSADIAKYEKLRRQHNGFCSMA